MIKLATNYASASFSEVYDMHTEVGKTTLIGIHTPITNRHQRYLNGFFTQFKKFRYKGASLSFVPVATLPADPLQVSYEAGEPTIDPRDLMNPIIHCGMHGQSMGKYLDSVFHMNISERLSSMDVSTPDTDQTGNIADLENAYYTALSSPTFKKSHPQHGFRKSGLHPMVYSISTNRPYAVSSESYGEAEPIIGGNPSFGAATMGVVSGNSLIEGVQGAIRSTSSAARAGSIGVNQTVYETDDSKHYYDVGQFFTNKLTSLGWLDTIQNQTSAVYNGDGDGGDVEGYTSFTGLPKVYMYFVMLPPAYKTEMYFRVVIRHFFEFRDFRPFTGPFSFYGQNQNAYDGVIENDPLTASMTLYNGDVELISDGAS